MSLYIDTSVWITSLASETQTHSIQRWLSARGTSDLTTSDWVVTEVSSALAQKVRTGLLTESGQHRALAEFRRSIHSVTKRSVWSSHFGDAARLCDRSTLGLRANDALHLAIAMAYGDTLCTRDRKLAAAAAAYGALLELV